MTRGFPDLAAEMRDLAARAARTAEAFGRIRDADVDVGATPREEIWRDGKISLHRYTPITEVKTGPVLIVYGLIGRWTMADLQEDRSLVRNLLARGVDLYIVDWGLPTRADRHTTIDDYVDWHIDQMVETLTARAGPVTLLGICEGGTFCACYAALYPDKVRNLILTITPIDFHGDLRDPDPAHGFIGVWTRNLSDQAIHEMIDTHGALRGDVMGGVFQMMTPIRTLTKYSMDMLDASVSEARMMNFLRMEKWLADRPDHPAAAGKQWLLNLYKHNELARGVFELSGRVVDLKQVTMPVLNIFAKDDHIIPPPCAAAMGDLAGTDDYTELPLPGGHVGVYVSSRSQGVVGDTVSAWLSDRQ